MAFQKYQPIYDHLKAIGLRHNLHNGANDDATEHNDQHDPNNTGCDFRESTFLFFLFFHC